VSAYTKRRIKHVADLDHVLERVTCRTHGLSHDSVHDGTCSVVECLDSLVDSFSHKSDRVLVGSPM